MNIVHPSYWTVVANSARQSLLTAKIVNNVMLSFQRTLYLLVFLKFCRKNLVQFSPYDKRKLFIVFSYVIVHLGNSFQMNKIQIVPYSRQVMQI